MLTEARQRASLMENAAGDVTTDVEGSRKRRKPKGYNRNHSQPQKLAKLLPLTPHSEKGINHLNYPPPLPKSPMTVPHQPVCIAIRGTNETQLVHGEPTTVVAATASISETLVTDTQPDFQKIVLTSLASIKVRMQQVEETQELILNQLKSMKPAIDSKFALIIPVKSVAALDFLEQQICTDENCTKSHVPTRNEYQRDCTNENVPLNVPRANSVHFNFGKEKGKAQVIEDAIKSLKAAPQRLKKIETSENQIPKQDVHGVSGSNAIDLEEIGSEDENGTQNSGTSDLEI
ncbi:unnamed protein product [Allacma fusca]|uniref:Uncharacterized protein n=1 Tax=Allacma fusca TaxID=39272 RepID=A0A8J2L322_9HEXA|nr:unnamed protein product [Allacma fusca]